MKILFFATYPNLPIGYSRIGNILSNYLAECGHDIYYLGISNFKHTHIERNIHPNIKIIDALEEEQKNNSNELYGVNVICDLLESLKPDLLFLYNDIIVISRIFNNFIERKIVKNFKTFIYLDLVYEYEKIDLINHVDKFSDLIFVFSNCWKRNLVEIGVKPDKIKILPHGIDKDKFFPINKSIARKYFNFSDDDFIVLNSNRNNYRKAIDKTIDAFILFLKLKDCKPKIKLFLNMNCSSEIDNEGYDIMNQIKIGCIKNKLDYDNIILNHIFINNNKQGLSDEMLNYLYNSCDVGINTCIGEGFGLCNLEHGGIGKPQIISGVGALNDIFSNYYSIVIKPIGEIYFTNRIDFHGGYGKICSTTDFTNALITYYDDYKLRERHGNMAREIIIKNYDWNNILQSLSNEINTFFNIDLI